MMNAETTQQEAQANMNNYAENLKNWIDDMIAEGHDVDAIFDEIAEDCDPSIDMEGIQEYLLNTFC